MIALAARIWDLPEPELPLPPTRTTARMSSPAAAAAAVVVMCDFIARPATSAQTVCEGLLGEQITFASEPREVAQG
jgi:hypothetical protein